MSVTQILVFDPESSTSNVQSALIESVWALPLVQIADLRSEYEGEVFDVARERRRLKDVDTVILQITETGQICPLLTEWLDKVVALDPHQSNVGLDPLPVVRRVGAVIVSAPMSLAPDAIGTGGFVTRLLRRLRRAVESVGIEWLSPQIIDPSRDHRSIEAAVGAFSRRLQGREPLRDLVPASVNRSAEASRRTFAQTVARASAWATLASALGQFALSAPSLVEHSTAQAWSGLVTSWLAISLAALVASALIQSLARDARLFTGVAASLFCFQIVSHAVPPAGASVLSTVPEVGISGAIVFFAAAIVLALGRPSRANGPGLTTWPREG